MPVQGTVAFCDSAFEQTYVDTMRAYISRRKTSFVLSKPVPGLSVGKRI